MKAFTKNLIKKAIYRLCGASILVLIVDAALMTILGSDAVDVKLITIPFLVGSVGGIVLTLIED